MQTEILYNINILPLYYKLGMKWESNKPVQPGQFIMLRIADNVEPLLRRPFGVYKIQGQGLEILYKVVGKGTRLMTSLKPGDTVDVLGPLGNGFPLKDRSQGAGGRGQKIIMVAGGIGIVPFYLLGGRGQGAGIKQKLLLGGRGKEDLPGLEDFKGLDIDISVSTDDGSIGKKGFVTDLLKKELSIQWDYIVYACGPKGMLKEVARITDAAGVPCYVSLDNVMACGIGACLGCAVKVRGQGAEGRGQKIEKSLNSPLTIHYSPLYAMVCKDGPVFDAKEIDWEKM